MSLELVDIQMRCINSQEETIKVMQSIIDKQSELIDIQKEIIRTCEEIEESYKRELRGKDLLDNVIPPKQADILLKERILYNDEFGAHSQ